MIDCDDLSGKVFPGAQTGIVGVVINTTLANDVHSVKAVLPMEETDEGIVMFTIPVPLNALVPIVCSCPFSGNLTYVRAEHDKNASCPILLIFDPSAKVRDSNAVHCAKAFDPIVST